MAEKSWRPTLRPGLKLQVVEGEALVLDRDNERIHQLNQVGSFILERCDGTRSPEDIADALVEHYEVTADRAAADTDELLSRMKALEIVR